MAFSAWRSFASDILSSRAVGALECLPPAFSCVVDYPLRIKSGSKNGDACSLYPVIGNPPTLYTFKTTIWDSFGKFKFTSATFITPSREPEASSLDGYYAEWNQDLDAYIITLVDFVPLSISSLNSIFGTFTLPDSATDHIRIQITYQPRSNVLDNVQPMDTNELFDIERSPPTVHQYLEDQIQYDFGLFAVHDVDVVPEVEEVSALVLGRSPTPSDPEVTDPSNIKELLKVQDFVWAGDSAIGSLEKQENVEGIVEKDILARDVDGVPELGLDRSPTPTDSVFTDLSDIEELLKVEDFVWADEFDDSVLEPLEKPEDVEAIAAKDISSLLKPKRFNWFNEFDDACPEEEKKEDTEDTSVHHSVDQIMPRNLSGPAVVGEDHFKYIKPSNDNTPSQNIDVYLDSPPQYPTCEEAPYEQMTTPAQFQFAMDQSYHCYSEAKNEEYWQICQTHDYPNIHHFNWFGERVMERSHTSPEVSLFIILSTPKACFAKHTGRQAVILHQAMKFVDPVLYSGNWDDLKLTGENLMKAITGRTFRFYTDMGTWLNDELDADMQTAVIDESSPCLYASKPWLPLNGWVETQYAYTRWEYGTEANRLADAVPSRRHGRQQCRSSPLRQCTMAGDVNIGPT
ncbi:hypothetical protein PAAG_02355 [Paracoccidioides lutzii Pb01]|uniref:Uncharacterized protein n=1 Tax=Paracoccidioides lutzii (strain ATCC MYA-826 / Pb01) TaxID=502779 RepID=C1GUN2_PARBA|nr:hypothetical protein PAAG_02355 [Paracoccidioides lutzii Pb01]EEH40300.2 hypothetical protein PAAG_02355 [Paracoccidioides lutzii Pb01]